MSNQVSAGGITPLPAWASKLERIVVIASSVAAALLLVEKFLSDWLFHSGQPLDEASLSDLSLFAALALLYTLVFYVFFQRPDLPTVIAERARQKYTIKRLAEMAAETAVVVVLLWFLGGSIVDLASQALRELVVTASLVVILPLAAIWFVRHLFSQFPRTEVGIQAWVNRSYIAVIAVISLWLLDLKSVFPMVDPSLTAAYLYDLSKDCFGYIIALVFSVGALYEASRHIRRCSAEDRTADADSCLRIAKVISVTTIAFFYLIASLDWSWVQEIELHLGSVVALKGWTEAQAGMVRWHIIARDMFLIPSLLAFSITWVVFVGFLYERQPATSTAGR